MTAALTPGAYRRRVAVITEERIVERERIDARPLGRRLLAPLASLCGAGLALGYLAAVDPNQPGHYPGCPTKLLFGVDCPGCGMMRATHDLVTGNIAGALDHNVLIVLFAPLVVVLWLRWFLRSWRGAAPAVTYAQFRRRNAWMYAALAGVLVFGVVRNFVPYLGSGIG
jgi:hypothetical protein